MSMSRLGCFAAMLVLAMASENQTRTSNASDGINGSARVPGLKVRSASRPVTILHISDTHSLHRSTGNLPDADILIHSGDVAKVGSDGELGDFNHWLSTIKHKYQHIFIIAGNHDYWDTNWRLNRGWLAESAAQSPDYFQSKITNAKVLNHEMVEVMGLKIWGAGWHPRRGDSRTSGGHWGSSHELLGAIYRAKPKAGSKGGPRREAANCRRRAFLTFADILRFRSLQR
eukprot:Skav219807  [mRNA]  locus=scaffold147:218959:221957:- [translate_table: standard]